MAVTNLVTTTCTVNSGGVANIVAISLQPADNRALCIEYPTVFSLNCTGVKRTVITDLKSPLTSKRIASFAIEAFTVIVISIIIVGLPGGIGSLEQQVRPAIIVSDNEEDMTCNVRICANEPGKVDA